MFFPGVTRGVPWKWGTFFKDFKKTWPKDRRKKFYDMPVLSMDYDSDIFTAIMAATRFFPEDYKAEYEMVLRTMELFDRVKLNVTKYPRFIVVIACFVVSFAASRLRPTGKIADAKNMSAQICIKLYPGWVIQRYDWYSLIEFCARYCVDVPADTMFVQYRFPEIEQAILLCVDFQLMPVYNEQLEHPDGSGEAPVLEYFHPGKFQPGAAGAAGAPSAGEATVVPCMDFTAIYSCARGHEIFHHWDIWKNVEEMERATVGIDRRFLVKFTGEIECPRLREVHARFSSVVAKDYVMSIMLYRFCWGKHREVTGMIGEEQLAPLLKDKAILGEVRAFLCFFSLAFIWG